MKFSPLNRHLWIKPITQEETEGAEAPMILLPDGYKPQRTSHEAAKVLEIASDCKLNIVTGETVIVQSAMIEKVEYGGEVFNIILENHILGTIDI